MRLLSLSLLLASLSTQAAPSLWVQVEAKSVADRSKLANLGISIEAVRSDAVWGFTPPALLEKAKKLGFKVLSQTPAQNLRDFPTQDARYHNYAEVEKELRDLATQYPALSKLETIGKSVEGRNLYALHINTSPSDLTSGKSSKPGMIYMGNHHAREHLSVEIPLMLARHLLEHATDEDLAHIIDSRDVWVLPMLNPDGSEHDVSTGQYQLWRKNRADNGDDIWGVDLNRNYSYKWGTGGASANPAAENYRGPAPFSEPESRAVRDFILARRNVTTFITYHAFSELILYPWGHSAKPVSKVDDQKVFETMARKMATMNGYTPMQASALYVASGDTTDWAYGELGMFGFTFELSPASSGPFNNPQNFYPGVQIIDRVFKDNLGPALYALKVANNPYQVLQP